MYHQFVLLSLLYHVSFLSAGSKFNLEMSPLSEIPVLWSHFIHTNEINHKHHIWFGRNPTNYAMHVETFAFLESEFFNALTQHSHSADNCDWVWIAFHLSIIHLICSKFHHCLISQGKFGSSRLKTWLSHFFDGIAYLLLLSSLNLLLHPPGL